jgi:hypothetical protein
VASLLVAFGTLSALALVVVVVVVVVVNCWALGVDAARAGGWVRFRSISLLPGKWIGFKLLRGHRETPELDCGLPTRG